MVTFSPNHDAPATHHAHPPCTPIHPVHPSFHQVTHDRYFLEATCSEILELDTGAVHRYKGSYERFLEAKVR